MLASQAAISVDNAQLYADLIEETQRREHAVNALHDAQQELARVSRLTTMGELVASIVHEVSQPLTAISASAGAALRWLERDRPDVEEACAMMRSIVSDSARTREVVRTLRALVKKSPPAFACFDINAAIREVVALTGGEMREHGIEFDERVISRKLPARGDRVQIQQVVLNLVVNAIEAMAEVARQPRVLTILSGEASHDTVFVEIADTGPGLTPAIVSRLFEPFVTTKEQGLGMGLSICRAIVAAHGGKLIALQCADQRGARFRFCLPRSAETVRFC